MVFNKVKLIYKRYVLVYIILVFISLTYFNQYYYVYSNLIAVSWGDGPYGKAMYGVYVYKGAEKKGKVQIKVRVYIGRQDFYFISYYRDFGVVGTVEKNNFDAWRDITWNPEGVAIGKDYFISKEVLGKHR
ncbi:hypothetical protein [Pseudenterobacter timonensis]|uniref:Uncharacterized protein n=1 Tax=Pseudenterobacter timonensis TaxID=1755099 RepID=A0ABV4A3C1_9ENTR